MQLLLYRLGTAAYSKIIRVAALFNPKAELFVNGRVNILDHIQQQLKNEARPRIWMHCASLGEFEQGRPVLEALRQEYPEYALVLTFFSPSGYEVRKNYDGADYIFYLPEDSPENSATFIRYVQPKLCVFVKYELWYYYLSTIHKEEIPCLLISAIFNVNHGFFKWYGGLQRKMLRYFNSILVQDANSQHLLQTIGINNSYICGDTRFDRVIAAAGNAKEISLATEFCANAKIIVAGSTWQQDEEMLSEAMHALPNDWKLILVPHEVHETHLNDIEELFGDSIIKASKWDNYSDARVLLIDSVGMLLSLYKYATIAYIGGGFGKAGVHNVLEAAVYGKPCIYGPIYHQFLEAVQLVEAGGGISINSTGTLLDAINELSYADYYITTGNAARDFVYQHQGATERVMEHIAGLLE